MNSDARLHHGVTDCSSIIAKWAPRLTTAFQNCIIHATTQLKKGTLLFFLDDWVIHELPKRGHC
jgi:hypothetical protein